MAILIDISENTSKYRENLTTLLYIHSRTLKKVVNFHANFEQKKKKQSVFFSLQVLRDLLSKHTTCISDYLHNNNQKVNSEIKII